MPLALPCGPHAYEIIVLKRFRMAFITYFEFLQVKFIPYTDIVMAIYRNLFYTCISQLKNSFLSLILLVKLRF